MFSKAYIFAAIALGFSAQAYGHAIISPALGVTGPVKKSDVQREVAGKPCGSTDIASNINSATAVPVDKSGSFVVTGTTFDPGADGSLAVTMQVDPTGTGNSFVAGQVTTNGNPSPPGPSTDQITAALPSGTKCSGGAAGNRCLVAFKTGGGFGNCIVVSQAQGGGSAPAATVVAPAVAKPAAQAAKGHVKANKRVANPAYVIASGGDKTSGYVLGAAGSKPYIQPVALHPEARAAARAGTRSPRAFLASLGADGEAVKRSVLGWIWA